jgi:hypothetical protein
MLPLVLLVLFGSVQSWGPISHQFFNCRAHHKNLPLAQCLTANPQLAVGSDFPDAFGFGAFKIGVPGYLCANLTYVHDPFFGGSMLLRALSGAGPWDQQKGKIHLSFLFLYFCIIFLRIISSSLL